MISKEKESDGLLYTARSLVMVRNVVNPLRWKDVSHTSSSLCHKICDIFSVLSIFKYNTSETNNKFITNNFYAVIYRRVQKESDGITVYGSVTRYGPREPIASAKG